MEKEIRQYLQDVHGFADVFSKEEKAMLINGLEALMDEIRDRKKNISVYMDAALDFGLLVHAGKLYEDNIHFFEMKDKIKQKLEDCEAELIQLRNKIYREL